MTGFPQMKGVDTLRMAEKVRGAIKTELWNIDKSSGRHGEVNVFRRKERLFMERKEPWEPEQAKRKPNPYPGDMPKVR